MITRIKRTFELEGFFHTLVPMLFAYHNWKVSLNNPQNKTNVEARAKALTQLDIWGRAICLQVGELHENPEFLNLLSGHCTERNFQFNPRDILSDALGERHNAEHLEVN
ncbi:MAG: hypothetical protein HYT93_04320 [Parcubacteria group bacterium]|nr:hypothetical protein [Parcubacteria group bacterium]